MSKWQPVLAMLEAFDSYFAGRVQTDRVEIIQLLPEQLADWETSTSGQLIVDAGEMAQPTFADWQTERFFHASSSTLTFNMNKSGPQHSRFFCEAMRLILDPKRLITELGGIQECPAHGFCYRGDKAEPLEEQIDADPRQLLTQSGFNGEELHLARTADTPKMQVGLCRNARLMASGSRSTSIAGADARCIDLGSKRIFAVRRSHLCRPGRANRIASIALSFIGPHLAPQVTERVDQHIRQLLSAPCDLHREELLRELERMLQHEHALLFLLHNTLTASYPSTVKNVRFTAEGWIDFSRIWFQPSAAQLALGNYDTSKQNPTLR
ncbi:hypothetical protein [Brevibacillus reuszeri]|uniref:hypothetical protein n=1 Tax=Brevibacillus reuszeri TaxID=54915 RepID=UPI003D24C77F